MRLIIRFTIIITPKRHVEFKTIYCQGNAALGVGLEDSVAVKFKPFLP